MNEDIIKNLTSLREKMVNATPAEKIAQKSLDDKPKVAGRYNISIENVKSLLPMFLNFDGENWTNLDEALAFSGGDLSKVTYWDRPLNQSKVRLSF